MASQSNKTRRAAKKKITKKKTPAKKQTKIDEKLLAAAKKALPAIRSGEITVRSVWKDQLKLESIAPLRRALTEILGGKAEYLAMLKARAKARTEKKKAATRKR